MIRCELNLCVGSPVTGAYGVLDSVSSDLKLETGGDDASSTEDLQSEYSKRVRVCDVLVDFQTGGNFPVLVRYTVYTSFVTKCDGAQTQASVFYIPTLVALSSLLL